MTQTAVEALIDNAEPDHAPRPGNPLTRTALRRWMLRITFLAAILICWQLYSNTVSRAVLAGPIEIGQAFWTLYVARPAMYGPLGTTCLALLLGLVIAVVLGIALGIGVGVSRRCEWIVGPYLTFLFAIPSIALIPLLIIWLGIGFELRVFLVVIAAVFPVIINTAAGVRGADVQLVETAHSFVATPRHVLTTVRLPAALPFIFAGINQALSLALAGIIVAEMTATVTGLGGLIITYANMFQTADLFVPILTLMAGSVGLNYLFAALETRLMPWHSVGHGS
jgi:NitT/TauT family transport system permease protein